MVRGKRLVNLVVRVALDLLQHRLLGSNHRLPDRILPKPKAKPRLRHSPNRNRGTLLVHPRIGTRHGSLLLLYHLVIATLRTMLQRNYLVLTHLHLHLLFLNLALPVMAVQCPNRMKNSMRMMTTNLTRMMMKMMMMRKMMKLRTRQKKSIMHCVSHTELMRQIYAGKGEIQTISLHAKFEH